MTQRAIGAGVILIAFALIGLIAVITFAEERWSSPTDEIKSISQEFISEECESGEFGLTFRDCDLGFKITRANYEWVLTANRTEHNRQQGLPELVLPNYLGGILMGKVSQGTVSIDVIDSSNFVSENPFEEFVNSYYLGKIVIHPNAYVKEPFFIGKMAQMEIEITEEPEPTIILTRFEERDNKFYVLSKSYRTDMAKEYLDDFRFEQDTVIKSFNYTK